MGLLSGRRLHGADFTTNQIEEAPKEATQVVAANSTAPTSTQFTMLVDMVKGMQIEMLKMQQQQADRQTHDSRGNPSRPTQPTC